jgi:toxin FitB
VPVSAGKRRTALAAQAKAMFDEDFALRCLPFDEQCASAFAELTAARALQGRPVSVEDAQIAAIALHNRKTLVTRKLADFENIAGLSLFNPW